jgi:hypothetical protein
VLEAGDGKQAFGGPGEAFDYFKLFGKIGKA